MEYSPLACMFNIYSTQEALHSAGLVRHYTNNARLLGAIPTIFHLLHQRLVLPSVAAVCTIYMLQLSNSPMLHRQHFWNPRLHQPAGQGQQKHGNITTWKLPSKPHTIINMLSVLLVNPGLQSMDHFKVTLGSNTSPGLLPLVGRLPSIPLCWFPGEYCGQCGAAHRLWQARCPMGRCS